MSHHILAINFGSTSTKIAWYEDSRCLAKENLAHDPVLIGSLPDIYAQHDLRRAVIMDFIARHGIDTGRLAAVVSRGGQTRPLPSGAYDIDALMLEDIISERHGVHSTNLGVILAAELGREWSCRAMTVDPPVSDEFEPLARLSGLPEISRKSSFHVLNQKAAAHRLCRDLGLAYTAARLIGVHLGGGVSVCAHKHGLLVDANNALDGDGPYSTSRSGGLPVGDLVRMCFSGPPMDEILQRINGQGGVRAYLGTTDMIEVERRIAAGDEKARLVLEGMCYQTAKEVGGMAAVLEGRVHAIFLTGGMANSEMITGLIRGRVAFIAPVYVYPGEDEMESLALGTLRVLRGEEPARRLAELAA